MCGSRDTFASKGPQVVKWFAGGAPVKPNDVRWISGAEFKRAFPSEARGFSYDFMKLIPVVDNRDYAVGAIGSSVRPITRRVIFVDTDKPTKCGAMCRNAKGPMCDCSCKGENHGASVAMSRARFAELDLKPTAEMAANAARGLELREKHGRGGTAVGVARARDIKNRANLSPSTVKRMHSFFSRHEGNQKGGEDDAGYIAWLLWGGDAGKAWAARKSEQIEKSESARFSHDIRLPKGKRRLNIDEAHAALAQMGYKLGTVRYDPAAGGSVYKVTQPNGSVIDMPAAKLTDFIYEKAKHMKSGTKAAMAKLEPTDWWKRFKTGNWVEVFRDGNPFAYGPIVFLNKFYMIVATGSAFSPTGEVKVKPSDDVKLIRATTAAEARNAGFKVYNTLLNKSDGQSKSSRAGAKAAFAEYNTVQAHEGYADNKFYVTYTDANGGNDVFGPFNTMSEAKSKASELSKRHGAKLISSRTGAKAAFADAKSFRDLVAYARFKFNVNAYQAQDIAGRAGIYMQMNPKVPIEKAMDEAYRRSNAVLSAEQKAPNYTVGGGIGRRDPSLINSRAGAKATMAKFKVGDRIAYKPYPPTTAGEIVEIREPTVVGDVQRRGQLDTLERQYKVRKENGSVYWVNEGDAIKASRAGAKATMSDNKEQIVHSFGDGWQVVQRHDGHSGHNVLVLQRIPAQGHQSIRVSSIAEAKTKHDAITNWVFRATVVERKPNEWVIQATAADGGYGLGGRGGKPFPSAQKAREELSKMQDKYRKKAGMSRAGAKAAFSIDTVKTAAAQVAKAYGAGADSAVIRKYLDRIVSVLSGNAEGGQREALGIHAQIGGIAEKTHGRDFMWSQPMQNLEKAIRSAGQFSRAGAKAAFSAPTLDEVLRIAKQMSAQGNEAAAKTLLESWFREHGKGGTQSKASRAGAKAAFEIKVGDRVRAGLAVKGGAGIVGTVTKLEDGYAHIQADSSADDKYGPKTYKAPIRLITPFSRAGAKPDRLTLAQRIAVEHDAKRMANR